MTIERFDKESLGVAAKTIRVLSAEAVEKANSGHPGMPMGMAECALALWLNHLRYDPKDPTWTARDRFVLSNGHGSMLIYSLLHLAGFDLSLEEIKNFRQLGSMTPGHPENFVTPGVECTTGPLGQGLANAVGMAIGQQMLATNYSSSLFDYRVFCFAGDGCLMEGITSEASSLAGHLGLGSLNVLYDDNQISIAGRTSLAFSEDVPARYKAYGWQVLDVDGHDINAVDQALTEAVACKDKPSIICAKTIIGKGSPNKADTAGVHGSALGGDELELTKKELGWEESEWFVIPQATKAVFKQRDEELTPVRKQWAESFSSWKKSSPEEASNLERQVTRAVPADLEEKLLQALPSDGKAVATRKLSGAVLQVLASELPGLVGGSADLEPSTNTLIKDSPSIARGEFRGRNIHFGVREHAMGAVVNGLAYSGEFIPYGSTFLVFSDYMRPAIRLAALSKIQSLFIFTHDSVFLGEDGPTHQPVEHVNSLRMIPNLHVFRPADAVETAVCYSLAVERRDGPSALIFTRQNIPPIDREQGFDYALVRRGAYVCFENTPGEAPEIVLVASGSEVSLAIEFAKKYQDSTRVRVVSMPCVERLRIQETSYLQTLIPANTRIVVLEAGTSFGWKGILSWVQADVECVSIDRFGASAPYEELAGYFGFTASAIAKKAGIR